LRVTPKVRFIDPLGPLGSTGPRVHGAPRWLSSGAFEAPEFPALDAAANDRRAAVAVELRDREWLQRRRRQLETEHSENGTGARAAPWARPGHLGKGLKVKKVGSLWCNMGSAAPKMGDE
jgi:hypothetical protein